MRAQDIMTTPPVTVTFDATVGEAAATMTAYGFTALPVVDSGGQLLGLLTEASLDGTHHPADTLSCSDPDSGIESGAATTVGAVMRTPGLGVDAECELSVLANRMIETRLRSMVVLKDGRVVGMATFEDVLLAISAVRQP